MRAARCISDAPLKCLLRGGVLPLYATAPLPAYSLTFSSFHVAHIRIYLRVHVCARVQFPSTPATPWTTNSTLSTTVVCTVEYTCPFFFFSHSRARGERKRERGRVLKVNCFLKVSPPRPSHIEIWTSFGARYCEQAHGPLFLSTCNYTRPGYRSQMFI